MTPISRLFALSAMCFFAQPAAAEVQEKPIYDQVVEIVASERGTVRRWAYSPKVTVIHDGEAYRDQINGLVEMVNARVPNFPGVGEVEFFDLSQFNRRLAGNMHFRMPRQEFDGVEGSIVRALLRGGEEAEDVSLTGSIFIFLTGLEDGITLGALTQSTRRLSRQFAEGTETRCYFNLMSKNDELRAGFIFINNDAATPIAECIYEEFLQTLGLLNDSQGSSVFTFDNTGAVREDRDPDFRLLEALYSDRVSPGDDAHVVADLFLNIAPAPIVEIADKP
ncbi:DUF2927 domain-containing protein [Cognatiyoonia sp. IB215182]|uniref:DUF2927 domain-containing protein n=1 Tax=Cognatiyoonia sp. IB215182 TaxID=3097353 RepID=UPI002A13ECC4|nr:DUF2927 domain-containing protein [Cognatiyoonia sp. IB215182]MDX8350743.1 DUF2927 domain-containing protein [Cognatiyoonia sp. IB215182]